jgi:hypothetical protein
MRPGQKGALALALVLILVGAAGCGYSAGHDGDEGVPIELGNLEINVQLTRFLNPSDHEDKAYLVGQTVPTPPGKAYLGIFLTIKNHGDSETQLPTDAQMTVQDTTGAGYPAIPSHTLFAAPLGTTLPGGGVIPVPDSPAANGPAQGSIVLFLVNQDVSENRPLKLEIEHEGQTGEIVLDL